MFGRRTASAAAVALALALSGTAHAAGPTPAFSLVAPAAQPFGDAIIVSAFCPGDFNGDGNEDAAYALFGGSTPHDGIVVQLGDGAGHLGPAAVVVQAAGAAHLTNCAAGDLNGDGRDDIAATQEDAPTLTIALGQANGTFATSPIDTTTDLPGTLVGVAIGDIDNDGKPDLAVAAKSPPADTVRAFKGDGSGGFAATGTALALPDDPTGVRLADVNNDQRADALVSLQSSSNLQRALGQADGTLAGPVVGQGFAAHSLALADYDGNGTIDLARDNGSFVNIQLGNGSGSFPTGAGQYPSGPANPNFTPISVAGADYNNDGLPDVAAGSQRVAGNPSVFFTFSGTGNSAQPLIDNALEGPFQVQAAEADVRVAAADFDNDGRADLIAGTGTGAGGRIAVLLNTTPVPGVVTGAASPVHDDSATINGTVFPSGVSTQYGVDFLSPSGTVSRQAAAGTVSGSGSQAVTIPVSGLTPDTDYRYRVYATSSNGTTAGKVRTFHTAVARPVNQSPPGLSGTSTLTCTDGTWTGSPAFTVAWLRGGNVIAGETGHTYTVQPSDGGSAIGCRVTAANAGGSVSADSPTFVIGAGQFPANRTAPTARRTGGFVACDAGEWSAGGTFAYAWLRDGNPIAGATGPGYVVKKADAGHSLVCRVTLTNSAGSASADSGAVAIPPLRCVVPKLRGATVRAAKGKLKAANCAAGKVKRVRGRGVKVGRVLRTSPKAGASRKAGTRVKLFVRR